MPIRKMWKLPNPRPYLGKEKSSTHREADLSVTMAKLRAAPFGDVMAGLMIMDVYVTKTERNVTRRFRQGRTCYSEYVAKLRGARGKWLRERGKDPSILGLAGA
jgi:hypothetical protein